MKVLDNALHLPPPPNPLVASCPPFGEIHLTKKYVSICSMCKEKRWKEISKSQKNDQRRGLHYLALGGCRAVFHLFFFFWHSH